MAPFRLAMLGMWHSHAGGIVTRVADHPKEFELVGFYDPDSKVVEKRRSEWAPKLPHFRVFRNPQELLQQDIDGVVVEGHIHENLPYARQALEAGKHVMLEKPAGNDLGEYQGLIDLAQRKHLLVQMIYLFRYKPNVAEMIGRRRRGELGEPYMFRARMPKPLGSYARYKALFTRFPGGIFFEMACHVIDMMVSVMGKPKKITPFMGSHHPEAEDFVDNGLAVFEFDRGWGVIEVPTLELSPNTRRIEVYGTGGSLYIEHLGHNDLFVHRAGGEWQKIVHDPVPLQLPDLREFAACVRRKKEPNYSFDHDLAVQEAHLRACGAIKS